MNLYNNMFEDTNTLNIDFATDHAETALGYFLTCLQIGPDKSRIDPD